MPHDARCCVVPRLLLCAPHVSLFTAIVFLCASLATRATAQQTPSPLPLPSPSPPATADASQFINGTVFAVSDIGLNEHFEIYVPPPPSDTEEDYIIIAQFTLAEIDTESYSKNNYSVPDILLFATTKASRRPEVIVENTIPLNDDISTTCTCTPFYPCFADDEDVTSVDRASFYGHFPTAFVNFNYSRSDRDSGKSVFVIVSNYDRKRGGKQDMLSGNLYIRYQPSSKPFCAVNLTSEADVKLSELQQCSGDVHGKCNENNCICEEGYAGRACETRMYAVQDKEPANNYQHNASPVKEVNFTNGDVVVRLYELSIKPFDSIVLHYGFKNNKSDVLITQCVNTDVEQNNARFHSDDIVQIFTSTGVVQPRQCRPGVDFLPSWTNIKAYDTSKLSQKCSFVIRCREGPCEDLYIRLFVNSTQERKRNLVFQECLFDECFKGRNPLVLIALSLVLLMIASSSITLVLWLDRRHGFTNKVDYLTAGELQRMYPTFKFRRQNHSPEPNASSEEAKNGEEPECLICLSSLEEGDVCRSLHCKHVFHSTCVDPWLTKRRASCPTCRAEVRVLELSDKRRMRQCVVFCMWPVIVVRRWRDQRRAHGEEDDIDEEEGNAGPRRTRDGVNVNHRTSGNPGTSRGQISGSAEAQTMGNGANPT